MNKAILLLSLLVWSHNALAFRPFILRSGKTQVHVLEFYDSEKCAICEDQRKWVTSLRTDKGLFKKFIVLALDLEKNADRVESLSLTGEDAPVFMLDGAGWTWTTEAQSPAELGPQVGELEVARSKFQEFEITFSPKEKMGIEKFNVTGALLGSGAKEFSVLELVTKELKKVGSSYTVHLKFAMKKVPDVKTYSGVFWISKGDDSKPIQAVGANLTID